MESELSDKTVLVVDSGWYVELAPRLAREFDRVLYWSPWQGEFPYAQDAAIGSGLEGVERVKHLWDAMSSADLVVFPAEGFEDVQDAAEKSGKRVWGSGRGNYLEEDRIALKEYLKGKKQPVIPYEVLKGINALEAFLRDPMNDDTFVKLAHGYRGDMETWHHVNWPRSMVWFFDLARRLGPMGATTTFMWEYPVEGFEGGSDMLIVSGQYPEKLLIGYEIKDSCYVSTVKAYSYLATPLKAAWEALREYFVKVNYRNLVSTENRITEDETSYMIDLAARFPWPPSGTEMENIVNLGEIMWHGSQGILVQPKFRYTYGVELNLSSPWLAQEWLAVEFPESIRDNVKLHSAVKVGDQYWVRPQKGNGETGYVGSVVALGNDFKRTCKFCVELASQVEGTRLEFDANDILKAEKTVREGEEHGIDF